MIVGFCLPVGASQVEPRRLFNFGKDNDGVDIASVAAASNEDLVSNDEANYFMDPVK